MSIVTKFARFLGRHSGELNSVRTILGTVIGALPISPAEKADVREALAKLGESADNIAAAAKGLTDSALTLTDADRESIAKKVARQLAPEIAKAVAAELDKRTAPPAPPAPGGSSGGGSEQRSGS